MASVSVIRSSLALGPWLRDCVVSLPDTVSRSATVLLSSPGLAHRLRRDVCLAGRPGLLAGVRIRRPIDLAREVLLRAGVETDPGLPTLRVIALRALLVPGQTPGLAYLRPERLPDGRSYAEAVAATIAHVEAAGLSPAALRAAADASTPDAVGDPVLPDRLRDLALLWEATDARLLAGNARLRSPAGILIEAAATLAKEPGLAAPFGDAFALIDLQPTTALLRFLAALRPRATALLAGRPERASALRVVSCVQTALGAAAELAPESADPPRTELDLVHRWLFAAPEELARPERPRSAGADGTVTLEQHSGVQQEIDAAVSWAIEEVTVRQTPLEEIAVVVPSRDPLSGFLAAAFERADKGGALSLPVYVAGGLPVTDAPAGARFLQLLLALDECLESERTIALLPHLRLEGDPERRHLTEAEARELVYRSGIVGGTPGNPERGREWAERLRSREADLRTLLAQIARDADDRDGVEPEKSRRSLDRRTAERLRGNIVGVLPAVEALTVLVGGVLDGASLPVLWPLVLAFWRDWCLVPPPPPDVACMLCEALEGICSDPSAQSLSGRDAVDYLVTTLRSLRGPHGRHGEPRVFIGTAADATLLPFRALRVLGAVEGAIPGPPREDPILPDVARVWLEQRAGADCLLQTSADRVLRETHEAFLAATGASERLGLSAPRQWVDGTDRELAGFMLEAAVALGRPDPATGRAEVVPSLGQLRRLYVAPGNTARAAWDAGHPTALRVALRGIAVAPAVPPAWLSPADGVSSLVRLRALAADRKGMALTRADGILGEAANGLGLPGLAPERGISASAMGILLGCPQRFLLETVLGLRPPAARPPAREIAPLDYGSLVHRVMEGFFRAHGAAFCRKEGTLADWKRLADEIVDRCYDEFLREYPLAGEGAVDAQRRRLRRDVEHLLRAEWESGLGAAFGAVEVEFGDPTPEAVIVDGGRTLYVRGRIDRIDESAGGLVLRDIKTGRPKLFDEQPVDLVVDAQIALYALVAPRLRAERPVVRAGYSYPVVAGDSERVFTGDDLRALLDSARGWFGVAGELLEARAFPHTTDAERCKYCAFQAVCGDDAPVVSRRKLTVAASDSPGARFAALQAREEANDAD